MLAFELPRAVNYPNPQGNVMWTAVEDPAHRPIKMDIVHVRSDGDGAARTLCIIALPTSIS